MIVVVLYDYDNYHESPQWGCYISCQDLLTEVVMWLNAGKNVVLIFFEHKSATSSGLIHYFLCFDGSSV